MIYTANYYKAVRIESAVSPRGTERKSSYTKVRICYILLRFQQEFTIGFSSKFFSFYDSDVKINL